MRIVVTGASGLTGAEIARGLVRCGHEVVGVTRRAACVPQLAAHGIVPEVADLEEPRALAHCLPGADALVHVAGIRFGPAVAAAPLRDLRRVVVISSAAVHSRLRASAADYLRSEEVIRRSWPDVLVIRPTMIYGSYRDRNVHRVISFARRWRALPVPAGARGLLQPIHYRDLASAVVALVAGRDTGIVEAGGPEALTIGDAGAAILAALGLPGRIIPVPYGAMVSAAQLVDVLLHTRWAEKVTRTTEDRTVDNTRLLALTGLALRTFTQGVEEEVAEMRDAGLL